MKRSAAFFSFGALLLLAACGNDFTPATKEARYDPATGEIDLPHPCPDWSKSAITNYGNSSYSNYGCAVNNNLAVQIANPEDLAHGSDKIPSPDTEITTGIVDQYRSGKIPQPLTPIQATATGQ